MKWRVVKKYYRDGSFYFIAQFKGFLFWNTISNYCGDPLHYGSSNIAEKQVKQHIEYLLQKDSVVASGKHP